MITRICEAIFSFHPSVQEPGYHDLQQLPERVQYEGNCSGAADLMSKGHEWLHISLIEGGGEVAEGRSWIRTSQPSYLKGILCHTPRHVPLEQLRFVTSTQWTGMVTGLWITWDGQSNRQIRGKNLRWGPVTWDKGWADGSTSSWLKWNCGLPAGPCAFCEREVKSSTDRPGAAIQYSRHPHDPGDHERVGEGSFALIQIIAHRLAKLGKVRKSCHWLCGAPATSNNVDNHLQCGGAAWICRSSWPWLTDSLSLWLSLYHDSSPSLFWHFVCDICKKDFFLIFS